ncbi:MAG: FHA domain-containing protein [Planctomycetaceae bacterium]|nr:FHA domain-containing protein [Planctomycetaceae bacterium]
MPAHLQADENNRSVPLDKPIVFVGRHPDCDLVINNSRKVSRKHCCLAEIDGRFVIRDLGSTNGVQINGKRVTGTQELQEGDQVLIGDCLFTFHAAAPVIATPPVAPSPPESSAPSLLDSVPTANLKPGFIEPVTPQTAAISHEMSSEIPIMIDEPEDDGFNIFPGNRLAYPRPEVPPKRRNRSDSDSHLELALD